MVEKGPASWVRSPETARLPEFGRCTPEHDHRSGAPGRDVCVFEHDLGARGCVHLRHPDRSEVGDLLTAVSAPRVTPRLSLRRLVTLHSLR